METLRHIAVTDLKETSFPLRPVRKTSVEYRELVDSVAACGVLQPLLVRPCGDDKFEVVEGSHRRAAAIECGLTTIPCLIREFTDDEVLSIQLQANAVRPTTLKSEFAERLHELMVSRELTLAQLARLVNKSVSWLRNMLLLRKLTQKAGQMVNRGEISIDAACMLARIPARMQDQYLMHAASMKTDEFIELCRGVIKNYRELVKSGRTEINLLRQYEPMPWLRQLSEIRKEAETGEQAGVTIELMGATTAVDGWRACLAWLLHLDPISIRKQYDKQERARHEKLTAQERRKKDRELRNHLIKDFKTHE